MMATNINHAMCRYPGRNIDTFELICSFLWIDSFFCALLLSQPSPLSSPVLQRTCKSAVVIDGGFEVHRVAPTVKGVAEGARVLREGQVVSIPTETTYYYCATMELSQTSEQHKNREQAAAASTNVNTIAPVVNPCK